jgi:hypothetical protein
MAGGGGGEDLGGDLGGDDLDLGGDDLGGDDLGGDLGGDDLGGDDLGGDVGGDEGGEEDVLLSAPGKRNDDSEEVRKAKDRIRKRKAYNPVANDGRKTAGRAKNYKSKASIETSTRTTLPGYMGPDGLGSLAKGLFEDGNTIYESRFASEEKKLLRSNREAQDLIKELKRSELKKNETEAQ